MSAVRRFNRFYTRQIGILDGRYLRSPFSLTEVRVLYELAHRPNITAAELCQELGLDRGYLSRMLQSFDKQEWIKARIRNGQMSEVIVKDCKTFRFYKVNK